jgi:hypothetical protein
MRLPILSGKHRFHLGCGFLKSNKTVLLPVRSSSTPSSAFLNSSIVTLTQSSSVFASFGCASRQRTTMLAVFSDNSSSDNVFDFPPLKNSVPLDKIPLQSHFLSQGFFDQSAILCPQLAKEEEDCHTSLEKCDFRVVRTGPRFLSRA